MIGLTTGARIIGGDGGMGRVIGGAMFHWSPDLLNVIGGMGAGGSGIGAGSDSGAEC